jgi:hypothetical protein
MCVTVRTQEGKSIECKMPRYARAEELKRRFNVEVELVAPKVSYRATISGRGESKHRHKKQTGGAGQFAEVWMRIESLQAESGVVFTQSLVGSNVDRVFVPSVEKGVQTACASGPYGGFPVTEPARHEMTVRELMSHTGGLTYGLFSRSQVDSMYVAANILDANGTLKDMIDKLARIPLRQQPGTLWHYSVSVDVQGYLVEVLSGQTFEEFLQERLFTPLDMDNTGFGVADEDRARFAKMYQSTPNGLQEPSAADALGGDYPDPATFFGGGGGLVSTIGDYIKDIHTTANHPHSIWIYA